MWFVLSLPLDCKFLQDNKGDTTGPEKQSTMYDMVDINKYFSG